MIIGLLMPLAGAAIVGVMTVAFVTTHRKNGFFIFRPGEGYEYVLVLSVCAVVLAGAGGGAWSVDHAIGLFGGGWPQLAAGAALGVFGGMAQLALFWRPGQVRPGQVRPGAP